jgi:sensor histidine kinase YesM
VWRATPFQLIAGLLLLAMMWVASGTRRQHLQQALQQARLAQERDAAARQLAEANLRLLQAQIEPHFLFNTLATLQHWVDTQDPRAPALLRALTIFLRASTEMFGREAVSLGDECAMARHYLDIMQARLGARLRYHVDIAPGCADQTLPPGLLMTLVENAVEHGIEPSVGGGEVRVRSRREDGACVLEVLDDGVGLRGQVQDGIGLANCRERLRHRFGDAATLGVSSREGGGTQAVVRWPAPRSHP